MKRFTISFTYNWRTTEIKPFKCHGDRYNKCDSCKARFMCYTGELPETIIKRDFSQFQTSVEMSLFGELDGMVDFDHERLRSMEEEED